MDVQAGITLSHELINAASAAGSKTKFCVAPNDPKPSGPPYEKMAGSTGIEICEIL